LFCALYVPSSSSSSSSSSTTAPGPIEGEGEGEGEGEEAEAEGEEGRGSTGATDYLRFIAAEAGTEQPADPALAPAPVPVPVYLVLTRERLLILDGSTPIGSQATVLANHHLTAVTKVVYRRRDPFTVTLSLLGGGALLPAPVPAPVPVPGPEAGAGPAAEEGLAFRLERRDAFIALLQRSMQRFK
jgi:hypothetical protein